MPAVIPIDIETNLPREFLAMLPHLKNTLKTYSRLLSACEIIEDPTNEDGKKTIASFIAAYAKIRNWANNAEQRREIQKALDAIYIEEKIDEEKEVLNLIKKRKFVILQSAPGTGKTRLAKIISNKLK